MDGLLLFWIMLCLGFLALEAATPGIFFFLAGAIGSAGSMLIYFLGFDFPLQAITFVITSFISLLIIKYATEHLPAFKTHQHQKSNVYALIGKRAIVIEPVKLHDRGYVKVNGESWAAKSLESEIKVGEEVEIVKVSGSHVLVKKISQ